GVGVSSFFFKKESVSVHFSSEKESEKRRSRCQFIFLQRRSRCQFIFLQGQKESVSVHFSSGRRSRCQCIFLQKESVSLRQDSSRKEEETGNSETFHCNPAG